MAKACGDSKQRFGICRGKTKIFCCMGWRIRASEADGLAIRVPWPIRGTVILNRSRAASSVHTTARKSARKNWGGTERLRTAPMEAANIQKGITSERHQHGARPFADNLRCGGCGIGSHRRLGRETTCGGGAESCVARSGARGQSERVY